MKISLRCPLCKKKRIVDREAHDYPEAVLMEVVCPSCDTGDFCSPQYYDADGNHIVRDPEEVLK